MAHGSTLDPRWSADTPAVPCPGAVVRWMLRVLTFVALGSASYLAWVSLTGDTDSMIGCAGLPQFDCEHVLTSRWAYWLGVPVSLAAVGVYAAMFAAAWLIGPHASTRVWRAAWNALMLFGILAAGAALWFVALLVLVTEKLCLWCIIVHACGLTAGGLILTHLLLVRRETVPNRQWLQALGTSIGVRRQPNPPRGDPTTIPVGAPWWLVGLGTAGAATLIAGQLLSSPPPTHRIEQYGAIAEGEPNSGEPSTSPVGSPETPSARPEPSALPPEPSALPPEPSALPPNPNKSVPVDVPSPLKPPPVAADPSGHRRVPILRGQAELDAHACPVLGEPDAKYIVVDMSDYSCRHCRKLHGQLQKARMRYGDQFAVIFLVVPMNTDCNEFVQYTHEDHRSACDYARLAMAVWHLDRARFQRFHDWLYEPERPPPVSQATRYAEELVGPDALKRGLDNPRVDETIRQYTQLFNQARRGAIPKLFFGTQLMTGEPREAEELFDELEKHLGIKPADQ